MGAPPTVNEPPKARVYAMSGKHVIMDTDVVAGMIWLSKHDAQIDCRNKKVILKTPDAKVVTFKGQKREKKFLMMIQAKKLLPQGCEHFIAYVIDKSQDPVKLEDIPGINEFPDPELLEKIRKCQEEIKAQDISHLVGEELCTQNDDRGKWDEHLLFMDANVDYRCIGMKSENDHQRIYADQSRKDMEFKEGDLVLLKVSLWKGLSRFIKKGKLSPRYVGPFKILKRVDKVAYELALPPHMEPIHNIFQVSMIKKYNPDYRHIIEYEPIELQVDLSYVENSIEILEKREKILRNKVLNLVRVLWRNPKVEESTWELESDMREKYPQLFILEILRTESF
ncbi:hypothetical protein AgCh_034953 [Apium graveolens]